MRRRVRGVEGIPEELRRFRWEDWREPAPPDHPFPMYPTWYLGLLDWVTARRAYAEAHGINESDMPRE